MRSITVEPTRPRKRPAETKHRKIGTGVNPNQERIHVLLQDASPLWKSVPQSPWDPVTPGRFKQRECSTLHRDAMEQLHTLCRAPSGDRLRDPLAETRHLQTTTASGRHRPPPPAERAAERRMVVTQSGIPGASATVTSRGWTSSSATSSLELPPCRWSTPVRYCPKTCRCATRSSSSCASHVRAPGSRRRSCSRVRRCS